MTPETFAALIVVIPLVSAPLAMLARRSTMAWMVAVAATAMSFASSLMVHLALRGADAPLQVVHRMGGWDAPVGITYVIDPVNSFVLMLVSGVATVVAVWARRSVEVEVPQRRDLFYAAYLLCTAGLLGMAATGDAFNIFVFLEISSLSAYALIAMAEDRRALTASFRYLIAGSLGGTFILIGIGLMYQMTGTLNLADLAERLPAVAHTRTVLVSFAFITVGTSLKLALWPLHFWLPNAYAYAPSAVSAVVSATATKVMIYVLARFLFEVYGEVFAFEDLHLGIPLMLLALSGIYVASTVAVFQTDVKRLLAYSSVGQIGYIVLGLATGTPAGVTAAFLHLFNHALMKGGMFLAVGNVAFRTGSTKLDDLAGLGKVMPVTTGLLVVGGAGLIGVPLTVGFNSKVALLQALFAVGGWPLAVLALASSLLAVAYVWKIVEVTWFREPSEALKDATEAPLALLIPSVALVSGVVLFAVFGDWSWTMAARAAATLLEGA